MSHLVINFDKELYYGDDVISKYHVADDSLETIHRIGTEDSQSATAKIKWLKR